MYQDKLGASVKQVHADHAENCAAVPPVEQTMGQLMNAISIATDEYQLLSNRLSSVKSEAPSPIEPAGKTSRGPSCQMEAVLQEALQQVHRLTDMIRSTRNGLCI